MSEPLAVEPEDLDKQSGFRIPLSLAERARNAAYRTEGNMALAEIWREGIALQVAVLETEHNQGRPFPPRPGGRLTAKQLRT